MHLGKIKITIVATSTLAVMAGAMIAPSLPLINSAFSDESNSILLSKLVLTIPALFIAIGGPIVGFIIDKYGRKNMLIFSILLYAVAGSSGLYLNNLQAILTGRAMLGLAVAGIMTTCITLIGDFFKGIEREKTMGLQTAFMALGGVIYLTIGGFLADINWRAPFLIYFSSFLFLIPVVKFIKESEPQPRAMQITLKPAVEYPKIKILFIYFVALTAMVLFYLIPVQLPFLLNEMAVFGSLKAGAAIAASASTSSIVALSYQRLKSRFSFQGIYMITFLFMMIGYIIFSMSQSYIHVLVGSGLTGLGTGLLMPNTSLWIVEISPGIMRGRIIGGLTTSAFFGQFLSPVVFQPVQKILTMQEMFMFASMIACVYFIGFLLYTISAKKDNARA
ncbi:MAG: MFS transporter [bacterium]|nr:MFS transporter [bacterium]